MIRDSLKRKFQPPSKRPSSSAPAKGSVQSHKASEQRPAKPEEEEDELPEELKRFGKDLVEKIENPPIRFGNFTAGHPINHRFKIWCSVWVPPPAVKKLADKK